MPPVRRTGDAAPGRPHPGPPPAELLEDLKKLSMGGNVIAPAIALAAILMAATGSPF